MRGDERTRYCTQCSRSVVNISLLTEAQRTELLAHPPPDGLCVSYYQRLSGAYVSAEQPLTPAESRRVVQWTAIAATAASLATAMPFTAEIIDGMESAADAAAEFSDNVADRGREALYRWGIIDSPPLVYMAMGRMVCPPSIPSVSPLPPASPAAPAMQITPSVSTSVSEDIALRTSADSKPSP